MLAPDNKVREISKLVSNYHGPLLGVVKLMTRLVLFLQWPGGFDYVVVIKDLIKAVLNEHELNGNIIDINTNGCPEDWRSIAKNISYNIHLKVLTATIDDTTDSNIFNSKIRSKISRLQIL